MHSIRRAVTLAIVVLVVLVAADVAQLSAQGKDPRIGTWKLNVTKSKYDPGPAPQSQTLKVDAVGKGEKVTSETVTADGSVRIVEIVGLDRQACGGTHLASTGRSRPVRILKIDNKGRHNRRIRFALD